VQTGRFENRAGVPLRTWQGSLACLFCLAIVISGSGLARSETSAASASSRHDAQTNERVSSTNNSSTPAQNAGALPAVDRNQPESIHDYCEQLAQGKGQADALDAVCEFALSLFWKLPNVICNEERTRYQEDQLGGETQRDAITATVRYEDGQEQYSQITINGKPAQAAMLGSSGDWSEGEFATDLRTVFLPQSAAQFKFVKQEAVHSTQAVVFDFKVERKNNHLRYFQGPGGATTYPGYHGRLWINKSNLHLMRLERKVDDVATDFPIQRADLVVDYADVDLADGTEFVLPVQAVNLSCPTVASSHCWHNQLSFKHWRKFAARARVLSGEEASPAPPEPPAEPVPPPALVSAPLPTDMSRGASIVAAILSGQSAEIERGLREAKLAASAHAEAANSPPQAVPLRQAPAPAAPAASAPRELPDEQVPVFKASVRLVLVPTVVRDSQGHAVDHLQKADFRLLDDRKPQLITQFSLERPDSVLPAPRESAGVQPLQRTATAATRHAAYVFDDIHATLDDLIRARDAAKRHLISLPPGDRAAIFTLSAKVMLEFTNDGAKLNEALQLIRPHPLTATGSVRCPDISYEQADLIQNKNDAIALAEAAAEALHCGFADDSKAAGPARRLAESTAAQVLIAGRAESQVSFNVLREVVRGISRMPGQRSVVLVSPGFPTAEMQQELEEIIDDALKAQVMINVLDPSGLSTSSQIQYGTASGSFDVLVDLAGGTGGTFFHNRSDMDEGFQRTALPEILYILGFAPQKLDGKLHKLKVTVQGSEKLSVQARRGYYALKSKN
jgi:VWFA-related protein